MSRPRVAAPQRQSASRARRAAGSPARRAARGPSRLSGEHLETKNQSVPPGRAGSDGSPEIEEITLSEQVYRLLRRDIMSGAFAPGQSLRLELLKQRYGSSSPIREALNRLRSERMVVSTTSRGFASRRCRSRKCGTPAKPAS